MIDQKPVAAISASALRAYEKAERADWSQGLPLTELLDRVNAVAAKLLLKEGSRDARVQRGFSPRSFRHYQTLGCIDPPARDGQRVVYAFRHFVQALLVRKLLWERVPAERIAELMDGRSTEETRGMLLEGVEIVAKAEGSSVGAGSAVAEAAETWRRVGVVPGVELHLRDDLPKPKPRELKQLVERLEMALRRNL